MIDLITLENNKNQSLIEGTVIRPLKVNSDETGILVETLRTDWADVYGSDKPFAMQYFSVTEPGIARDENLWHYHPSGQQDRFIVIHGSIVVAVADNRKNSPTKGLLNLYHMDSKQPYMLVIPKQALHGFIVTSSIPATLINFPTRLYDPKEEGRIPYEEAKIMTKDNTLFSWNLVRESFSLPTK